MSCVNDSTPDPAPTGFFGGLRRLYDWVLSWAQSPYGVLALFVLSFVESSFFPIPPDPLLMALCLGLTRRSLWFATVCTLASVLGGLFGYLIGQFAFDAVAVPILEWYGVMGEFDVLRARFRDEGSIAVFIAALTPVPYKLVTITAGVADMELVPFTVASLIGRGMRFFLVAGLILWKGAAIAGFIERNFEKLTLLFGVLVVAGFAVTRLLF